MSSTAVSYKSSAFHSKMSDSNKVDSETRELRNQCDVLRKELERKDARNAKTAKEMQEVRSSFADLQRELRMTTSTIDKIKNEKLQSENETADLRVKNQLLSRKLKTANDPQGLIDQISRDKKSHSLLEENIVNLRGELSLRELKIEALTRELVIAHRSIEVQSKYENFTSTGVSNNREMMRSLYFDMGKKQTDLHSVTLALAEATQRAARLDEELTQTVRTKNEALVENEKLAGNVEYLNRQSVEFNDEISLLRSELNERGTLIEKLHAQLERSTANWSATRAQFNEASRDSALLQQELTSAVAVAQQEKSAMQAMLERDKEMAQTREAVSQVREEQLHAQLATLQERNAQLADQAQVCNALQAQLEILRANLSDAEHIKNEHNNRISELLRLLSQKELSLSENNAAALALDQNLMTVHAELTRVREQLQQVTSERNEAVEALRQTMRAARELSQKYHMEKDCKEQVERTNQQLLQAKANLSAATLDALYQERRKSAALEKSLALVPLVLKWRAACVPDSAMPGTAQTTSQVAMAAGVYAHHSSSSSSSSSSTGSEANNTVSDLESVLQASRDINFVAAAAAAAGGGGFDTAAAVNEGVNATFDWLLNEDVSRASFAKVDVAQEAEEEQKQEVEGEVKTAQPLQPSPPPPPPPPQSTPPATAASSEVVPPQTPPAVPFTLKSPGVAAIMAEAYLKVEQGQGQGPGGQALRPLAPSQTSFSMVSELKRLRDELRTIELHAPDTSTQDTSVSSSATFQNVLNNISFTASMNLSSTNNK